MTNTAFQFVLGPIMAWLTVVALGIVGYLARLEYLERRKHRRMDAKRGELEQFPPLHGAKRPLAMKKVAPALQVTAECPMFGRAFQKLDTTDRLRLTRLELN